MPTDEELVRGFVLHGEPGAFDELVRRHLPLVRRLLYAILAGNAEDVEDAQQEVLVALYRGLQGFRGRSAFRTWLYRFVRNRGIDYLRRITRMRARERRTAQLSPSTGIRDGSDPEAQLLLEERRDQITEALGELPAGARGLLMMREVEGLELTEISRILGVPTGTVKSRLHRTRARLAEVLRSRGVCREA